MKIKTYDLWNKVPLECTEVPKITEYIPEKKLKDCAVVIFPGGGYHHRAPHEGDGYARFLCERGITAFVVDYRVMPHTFPCQLLDARRAVKFVRHNAEKYGINKDKIAVMGSSAGAHLASLVSTYYNDVESDLILDDIEEEDYLPNAQILCYPVISLTDKDIAHKGSGQNLLGDDFEKMGALFDTQNLVSDKTPPAFIWHNATDGVVNVLNSFRFAEALKNNNIPVEMHIFPCGRHGMGLCDGQTQNDEEKKVFSHVSQWVPLFINWLDYIGF